MDLARVSTRKVVAAFDSGDLGLVLLLCYVDGLVDGFVVDCAFVLSFVIGSGIQDNSHRNRYHVPELSVVCPYMAFKTSQYLLWLVMAPIHLSASGRARASWQETVLSQFCFLLQPSDMGYLLL